VGLEEGGHFLLVAVLPVVDAREVELQAVVGAGGGDAVEEEGLGGAPGRQVGVGEEEAGGERDGRQTDEEWPPIASGRGEGQQAPGDGEGEADAGR
jgi:hypothetical protein